MEEMEPFRYDDVNERRTLAEAVEQDRPVAEAKLDLNHISPQQAEHLLWKLYLQDHISKYTWTRATREVREHASKA